MKRIICTLFLVMLLAAGWVPAKAQIALSPSFVFIDGNSGVGDLFVSNKGDKTYEISISFIFGYPGSDSLGNLVMNYDDPKAFKEFALDSMVRAFPRTFTLPAGQQRTVRLQIIPGQTKKEGFFFTRMKVMAKPEAAEITEKVAEGVTTQLKFNFEQITAVFYHKGKVTTGLEVKKVDLQQTDSTLKIFPYLKRTGNSPFIGSMYASLKTGNKVVAESQSTTTAYFDVLRPIDINIKGVKPGNYTLELRFETRRNDMDKKDLVQAPKLVHTQKVVIK